MESQTLFLLTFTLTLAGNFLNILHAGRGLNLSRNKRIKCINLKNSKKIGYRLRPKRDDVVVALRNAEFLLFYYFVRKNVIFWPTLRAGICSHSSRASLIEYSYLFIYLFIYLLLIISTGYIFRSKIIGSGATSTSSTSMLRVSGKQNSLFPLGPVLKCLFS